MKNFKYLMTFESYSILGRIETVTITNEQGETVTCDAKIDTGSYSSRISADIAKKLKLPVIDQKKIKSVMGEENRTFVELQFKINGIEIKTTAGIANMEGLRNEVAIGRKDIEMVDGIVDVKKNNKKPIGIPVNKPFEAELEVEPIEEPTELIEEEEIDESVQEEPMVTDITTDVKMDLKKNFQYWKTGHDNEEDAKDLLKLILKRNGIASGKGVDEIREIVYKWVGYIPGKEPITESLSDDIDDETDDINKMEIELAGGHIIEITPNESDERSNRKERKTYHVNYQFILNDDVKEIEGTLSPYDSGRAIDYEFDSDYFTDKETEEYYDDNWEEVRDQIMEEFYKK